MASGEAVSRRQFVRAGAFGALGLGLSGYLRRAEAGEVRRGAPGQAGVVVWLGGGPPHLDTFDMKPDAPAEIRGEFKPIPTNVSGIEISEHLPKLARCAHQYAILRGVSHTLAGHGLGTQYMSTGSRPVPSLIYPGYGAVVSKELQGAADLPHFVAIPSTPQQAGYLGVRQASLRTDTVPQPGVPYTVRGIALAEGTTVDQIAGRQRLLARLNTTFTAPAVSSKLIEGLDRFGQQAFDMITSSRARQAFDVTQEHPAVAEAFGKSRFGMSCLLAARLVEAGVRFVTVSFSGWDTHSNNFRACKQTLLPQLDEGLSGLLTTLAAKGLLESTAVMVAGEFGRTPKINAQAGRDHWPRAGFVLMAGAGTRGGQVIGASDGHGSEPAHAAITPEQVAASFYHSLGIDYRKEYHTSTGRPVMIVREGSVIPGLFA